MSLIVGFLHSKVAYAVQQSTISTRAATTATTATNTISYTTAAITTTIKLLDDIYFVTKRQNNRKVRGARLGYNRPQVQIPTGLPND